MPVVKVNGNLHAVNERLIVISERQAANQERTVELLERLAAGIEEHRKGSEALARLVESRSQVMERLAAGMDEQHRERNLAVEEIKEHISARVAAAHQFSVSTWLRFGGLAAIAGAAAGVIGKTWDMATLWLHAAKLLG